MKNISTMLSWLSYWFFWKYFFFAGVRGEESCLGLSDLGFFHTACLTFHPCVSTEIKQHKSFRNKIQDDRAGGRLLEKTPFQQASERHHKRGTGSGSAHSTQGAAEAGARSGRTGSSPGCAVIKSCCPWSPPTPSPTWQHGGKWKPVSL